MRAARVPQCRADDAVHPAVKLSDTVIQVSKAMRPVDPSQPRCIDVSRPAKGIGDAIASRCPCLPYERCDRVSHHHRHRSRSRHADAACRAGG